MTTTEAAGIIVRIARYYPSWLGGSGEEETRATMRAWAEELAPLGTLEEVWPLVLACLRASPSPWPPGIFEIRAFVRRGIDHARLSALPKLDPPSEEEREAAGLWIERIRGVLAKRGVR